MTTQTKIINDLSAFADKNERGDMYGSMPHNALAMQTAVNCIISADIQKTMPPHMQAYLFLIVNKLVRIFGGGFEKAPHKDNYLDAMNYIALMYESHHIYATEPREENKN